MMFSRTMKGGCLFSASAGTPRADSPTRRPRPANGTRADHSAQSLGQCGNGFKQIAHDAVIAFGKNGGVPVLIDCHDDLCGLDARVVLHRA